MVKKLKTGDAFRQYSPNDFGEEDLQRDYSTQLDDARSYFLSNIKPRLDRSYKLYIAYNGDRAKEIQKWQANIFVPYTQSVIETLMPRILDARPDFSVQGRNAEDQSKAKKLEKLADYYWEKADMDGKVEDFIRSAMVYGTGFLQVFWKKDVRELEFLRSNNLNGKLVWKKEKRTFYDAPCAEWVDNYNLWYDWRNVGAKDKRFWFKRAVITKQEIERRYPMADPKKMALIRPGGDVLDYAQIRRDVKLNHEEISRGRDMVTPQYNYNTSGLAGFFQNNSYNDLYEVFEWHRPLDDRFAVMVNGVPILKGGEIPNPYDFKETVFIAVPYLKVPGEFEGYGIPMILENPQIMLNMIKNQRLDAVTLNIHKMWIVNPLANINKKELVTRPFGIIYSTDPQGVREVEFSDVKSSAFEEEKLIKSDMRYASGVDDFSMGESGASASATEVRHLRESTIERVRLFINHLADSFATLQRYWLSMTQQFFTKDMILRVIGNNGEIEFPLIAKDDIMGEFDFKATILPSIAGQNEIKKKQDMDLLQLFMNLPPELGLVDMKKVIAKVLYDWNWDYTDIAPDKQPEGLISGDGAGAIPGQELPLPPPSQETPTPGQGGPLEAALALLGKKPITTSIQPASPFAEAAMPIPLVPGQMPPTAPDTTNPRGLNRAGGGRVNTNIPSGNKNANPTSALLNRVNNIQR
ncbi:hypothetical protein M0R04_06675 [Candidatus Dojkabacteria bacterium]|jgi:hypothetical protein|nr:hypothetical protein [Candidatus Dojkabacteria bacterium]